MEGKRDWKCTCMPGPCVSWGTPTNHGERVQIEVQTLWDFFAAQLEASGVCSVLQPSCIKPVCDINTLLLHFD